MKIVFPKAEDFLHREDLFFDQMELALYHARKAWAKISKQEQYQQNTDDLYPWIKFSFPDAIEKAFEKYNPDYNNREVALVIEEL